MNLGPLQKTLAPLLRQTLNTYSLRQTAIGENIANVETEGFRPLDVEFEQELRRALSRNKPTGLKSDERHLDIGKTMDSVQPRIEELDARVNVEDQMAEMARNQIRYEFVARKLHAGYEHIKAAIRGRMG